MEYYFEASEVIEDPDTNPSLSEMVRLRVKGLDEAKMLVTVYGDKFPPGKGLLKFHTHDHKNAKPCKAYDLREILKGNQSPEE